MSELTLERTFPAAPERLFELVTQTDNLLQWWGPEGLNVQNHDLDLSRPGNWWSVLVNAEGGHHKMSGVVVAVDPPRSVEFTWGWHDENDNRGHESHVRFEISENGSGGAHFRLIHTGLPDDESAHNHNNGWSSSLNKLQRIAV